MDVVTDESFCFISILNDNNNWDIKKLVDGEIIPWIKIRRSTFFDAGLGAFADTDFDENTILGHFSGFIQMKNEYNGYTYRDKHTNLYFNSVNNGIWTRYINCCRGDRNIQNITCISSHVITTQKILKGNELFSYYGPLYWKKFNAAILTNIQLKLPSMIFEELYCPKSNRWTINRIDNNAREQWLIIDLRNRCVIFMKAFKKNDLIGYILGCPFPLTQFDMGHNFCYKNEKCVIDTNKSGNFTRFLLFCDTFDIINDNHLVLKYDNIQKYSKIII